MSPQPINPVTSTPAADPATAAAHFGQLLQLETDCWDVHETMSAPDPGFVLVDVRGQGGFDAGHVDGAVHCYHADLNEAFLDTYPDDTLFVVYCAGPHCNGADKAAVRLANQGRTVKKMIGGIEGWKDEGFPLATT